MLAYMFWHRPLATVDIQTYEARLAAFHVALGGASRAERVRGAPWMGGDGYLDWYFVPTWAALGELNRAAVTGAAEGPHAAVARLAGWGAGAVATVVRGEAAFQPIWHWLAKPDGMSYPEFLALVPAGATLWQRQLVLGPQPEFGTVADLAGMPSVQTEHFLVWGQDRS